MSHRIGATVALVMCLCLVFAAVASAVTNRVSSMTVTRFGGNPLITNAQAGTAYMNGSEPKQKPTWMTGTLSSYPYIMFFADHEGDQIYVASASAMSGPWTIRTGAPLALTDMPSSTFIDHMASPDVHILDNADDGQGFRMYWHGVYTGTDKQCSGLAHAGTDPLNFTPDVTAGQQWTNTLGRFYFRVFEWRGKYYTMAKFHKVGQGELWTADTPQGPFHKVKNLVPLLRHCGILVKGDVAMIFYTQIGDAPEHIEMVTVDLNGDPSSWVASDPLHILNPDMTYEGSAYPIVASVDGAAKNVRQLRDPSVIEIGGTLYMFYSGNGEDNICGSTVSYSWGTAPGNAYKVTVNGGSGDGTYKQNDVVRITAKQPAVGQKFNGWTGSTQYLADATKQTTTLTVPAANVTVTASWASDAGTKYQLTVHDGLGEGWYNAGTVVNISSMTAPSGMSFDKWTGTDNDVAYVANRLSSSTTVTMPSANVTVAAGYWDSQTTTEAFEQKSDSNGVTVMEAENEDSNIAGGGKTWTLATNVASYSGAGFMQATPNSGTRTMYVHVTDYTGSWDLGNCARMNYRVYFRNPGYHFIQVRTNNNGSNTDLWFKAGLNGVPISSYDLTTNVSTSWTWAKVDYYVFKAWVYVPHAGINTINIWSTDDGARVDKIVLSTNPDYVASGTGPTESERILPGDLGSGGTTYALTVNSGTGDGNYSQGEQIAIAANMPPPTNKVFDQWTGGTAYVDDVYDPTTVVTMPAAAVTVTATYKDPPAGADGAFREDDGLVSMEAENFTSEAAGTGGMAGTTWNDTSSFTGASGSLCEEALPNTGLNALDGSTDGCRLDFKVYFQNPGNYYLLCRMPILGGGDNSVNVGADGSVVSSNLGHTAGEWRWPKAANAINISSIGVHTINVWMREDGVAVDKLVLTTNSSYALGTSDLGPAESPTLTASGTTYTLTVTSGSGDGSYSQDTVVNIVADAPQSGYAFDEWTGATSYIANVNSSSTTVTMPAQNITVTATYVAIPTYALTVTSGTGDGSYAQGTMVNIAADAPQSGYAFDDWEGAIAYVADVDDPTTVVTMPAQAITVTATYVAVPTYALTVTSGTGDGSYAQGAVVNISADAPQGGYQFDQWTGATTYVGNVNSANTTVTMPAQAITVTATYEAIPTYTLTVTSGTGDGSYAQGTVVNISADAPQSGYEFDVWTGATAYIANVNSSSTTVTMPAQAITVTATYAATGGLEFQESAGLVSMETEHYASKANGTGSYTAYSWTESTPYTNASNSSVMIASPNNGVDAGTGTAGPVMNFDINFSTTGVYYVHVRFPPLTTADNTINVGMNGSVTTAGLAQGSTTKWKWMKAANSITVPATGSRTFNIWMAKDGCITDKIVLTTNASAAYDGGQTGPAESPLQ